MALHGVTSEQLHSRTIVTHTGDKPIRVGAHAGRCASGGRHRRGTEKHLSWCFDQLQM